MKKAPLLLLPLILVLDGKAALAASANGTATATVRAAIAISSSSDLAFGLGTQGDSAVTIAAGTSENADNASFAITGAPSTAYTVTLPADGDVVMTTGDGVGATKQIAVDSFTYYSVQAASASSASTGAGGTDTLLVGGTRAALAANQVVGSYSGSFTVTVAY